MTSLSERFARRPAPRGGRAGGFTLLELMVVLAILALLSTIVAPQVMKHLGRAKRETARVQVNSLNAAVEFFQLDVGRYPTGDESLRALLVRPKDTPKWDGPYVKNAEALTDPWGRPYGYRSPGEHGAFDVYTLGADGAPGGSGDAQDLGNW